MVEIEGIEFRKHHFLKDRGKSNLSEKIKNTKQFVYDAYFFGDGGIWDWRKIILNSKHFQLPK